MFASQTRDLSHIEFAAFANIFRKSANISSLSVAKAYRVGEAHISTEEKIRARTEGFFSFYSCSFLLV
jgi:hypothetical protein